MKKFLLIAIAFSQFTVAQERPLPQVNVNGVGIVRITPDQVSMSISVETKGNKATDVKRQNDEAVAQVVAVLQKSVLKKEDVQTQRVTLNPVYDYEKKKHSYHAMQTIEILLRDLSRYDVLLERLVDAGVNRIDSIVFKSSQMPMHEQQARKDAIRDAKAKAEDYVSVLNQKVGRAIAISDNSQQFIPQPLMMNMMEKSMDSGMARETLAVGEISVMANVNVSFLLE